MATGTNKTTWRDIFSGTVPRSVSDPLLVFLGFLLVYSATFDRSYFYDSVLYAGIIRSPLGVQPLTVVFEWNHPLWYPVTRSFYLLLRALGFGGLSYEALQWFNAAAGGLGLAVFFSLLRRALPAWQALFWTLLTGLGAVYWGRATGAEPYLAGTLFIILFCAELYDHFLKGSAASFARLCLFAGLASGFHIANNLLWVAAAAALLYRRSAALKLIPVLAGIFLAFSLPYAAIHGFFTKGGLARWWLWGSGLVNGVSPEGNPLGQFETSLTGHLLLPLKNLAGSFVRYEAWPPALSGLAAALAAAALLFAAFRLLRGGARDPGRELSALAAAFGLPFALFMALYSFWQPENTIYWSTNAALGAGLLAAALGRAGSGDAKLLRLAAFSLAALAGVNNFFALILPNYRGLRARPGVKFCEAIAYFTHPDSPVIISGGMMKVYLPYFANRERISLHLAAINAYADKKDPVVFLRGVLEEYRRRAVPIYMTDDVLREKGSYAAWHVSEAQIDSLLKPYLLMKVFRYDGEDGSANTLYLLWPRNAGPGGGEAILENLRRAGMARHAEAVKRFLAAGGKSAKVSAYALAD